MTLKALNNPFYVKGLPQQVLLRQTLFKHKLNTKSLQQLKKKAQAVVNALLVPWEIWHQSAMLTVPYQSQIHFKCILF